MKVGDVYIKKTNKPVVITDISFCLENNTELVTYKRLNNDIFYGRARVDYFRENFEFSERLTEEQMIKSIIE